MTRLANALAPALALLLAFSAVPAALADEGRGSDGADGDDDLPCDDDEVFDPASGRCEDVDDEARDEDDDADEADDDVDDERDDLDDARDDEDDLDEADDDLDDVHDDADDVDEGRDEDDEEDEDDDRDARSEMRERTRTRGAVPCHDDLDDDERGACVVNGDRCVIREVERDRSERLENGTRFRERIHEKIRDCPGTDRDRSEVRSRIHWRERDRERIEVRHAPDVRIERDERVKVVIVLPGDDDEDDRAGVDLDDNATQVRLTDKSRAEALQVKFLEALEFEDLDGNRAFSLDDRIVAAWRLDGLPVEASNDNGTVTVSYALPRGGTLAFVHHDLGSDRAKFDVVLSDVNWTTPSSQIALRTAFSARTAEYRTDLGDPAIVTEHKDGFAYFDWKATADADGQELPVGVAVYVGDGAAGGRAQLYLSYPRADRVVHDPSVGFLSTQSVAVVVEALLHPAAYVAAAAAGAAFVALGWASRKRN